MLFEGKVLKAKVRLFGLCALCAAGLSTGCFSPASGEERAEDAARAKEAVPCIDAEEAERMADQVLELINLERTTAEPPLPPVSMSTTLTRIAGDYACRMIEEGFFGHRDPITGHGPGQRAVAGKYSYYAVGENLAAGGETPAEVMRVWMESPSHRDNVLHPIWKEVGIGVRAGGPEGIYWVLEFGDPANY